MDDFLDRHFSSDQAAIDLDNFYQQSEQPFSTVPDSTVRVKAATTALLSGNPEEAVDRYRQMLYEAQNGQSTASKVAQQAIDTQVEQMDTKQIMGILSDSSVPFETKQAIVNNYKNASFLKDNATTLHTNLLSAPSTGESVDHENARLSTADAIGEIYKARSEMQGLVNSHIASLESRGVAGATSDFLAVDFLPFGNMISKAKIQSNVASFEGRERSWWDVVKESVAPGDVVDYTRNKLANMAPEQRVEFTKKLISAIGEHSGIIFGNDNQYAQFRALDTIFQEGGYSSTEQFLDNASVLLDIVGLGQLIKAGRRAIKASSEAARNSDTVIKADWELVDDRPVNPFPKNSLPNGQKRLPWNGTEDKVKRIERNYPVHNEMPASPGEVASQANPNTARDIHNMVFKAEGDEAARAMYGVDKEQATVNNTFPQAATESGRVYTKPFDIHQKLRTPEVPEELVDLYRNTGAIYFTKGEKARARASVVNDFANAEGMTINEGMSSFTVDGGSIYVDAVYGANNGAWSSAKEALDQAKFALRNYGIDDKDISILAKDGLDHVPVDFNDVAEKPGNYLIRVRTPYEIMGKDVGQFDELTTRLNFFDRIPFAVSSRKGGVSRYLFDASSMIDPKITAPASVAADATSRAQKVMLSHASEYSDKYMKLADQSKAKIDDYIREANFNEIHFDTADLIARGFNQKEIEAVKSWRDFWDGHYYLENYDVIRSLRNKNYQVFETNAQKFFAKPLVKDITKARVYDPATDSVRTLSRVEMDDLYNKGGTFAEFRRPINFNGEMAERMMVRNTPSEYLRSLRDSDQVLNYRNGYYQIQYKAAKFVDQIERNSSGAIISRKTVAVAGDTKEAQLFADRQTTNTGLEHTVRDDYRAISRDSDEYWDLQQTSGRIAQRARGKLLEDASGLNHLGDGGYIVHPVKAAEMAAKSIAGRTVTRSMLETAKQRIMAQFPDAFPMNEQGFRKWPSKADAIGKPGAMVSKYSADARTNWEYVNYLENGYLNSIDEFYKASFQSIADLFGEMGFSKFERFARRMGEIEPTGLAKGSIYTAYMAANTLRQFVVQQHQIVRTLIYNPIGWAKGGVEKVFTGYLGVKSGLIKNPSKEIKDFVDFVDNFGALAGVDSNNLVRGTLKDAADNSSSRVVKKFLGKPLAFTQKVGFELGEQSNLLGHASAVYDRYKRLGENLADKSVRDKAYSEIRALSYDMNFAGDMPYNQTSPSVILQFMQVPHKAALQLFNRRLPVDKRIQLALFDLAMWGVPVTGLVSTMLGGDILPNNENARKALTDGMESVLLNKFFTSVSGERTDIDFSSLAPYSMDGWAKVFVSMWTGGAFQTIQSSPSGQFFAKDGGRFQNAIGAMSRYFAGFVEPQEKPETFLSMLNEVAKMSSGWNNAVKAKIMLDTRKVLDQYGNVIDNQVSSPEAIAQLFGFGTADTRAYYALSKKWNDEIKANKKDVEGIVDDVFRYYKNQLAIENSDPKFITGVTGIVMNVLKDNPEAQRIAHGRILQHFQGEDKNLIELMMRRANIVNSESMLDDIRRAPVDDETKKMMEQRFIDTLNAKDNFSKENK